MNNRPNVRFFSWYSLGTLVLGGLGLTFWSPSQAVAQVNSAPETALTTPSGQEALAPTGPNDGELNDLELTDFFMEGAEGVDLAVPLAPPMPPTQVAPVAAPAQTAPVAAPTQTAPVAAPTQTAPVAAPTQTAPVAAPTPTAPVAAPTQTTPVATPAQTTPVAAPAQTAPVAAPAQTAPVAAPTPTAPVAAPAQVETGQSTDPFNLPPPSPKASSFPPGTDGVVTVDTATKPDTAASGTNRSYSLGGETALPRPQWENLPTAPGAELNQFISGQPQSEYNASQGNWIQLEVGQGDGSTPARPTSIYSVPGSKTNPEASPPEPAKGEASQVDKVMDKAIQQPVAGSNVLEPAEREKLRNLFSDMLPPEPLKMGQPPAKAAVQEEKKVAPVTNMPPDQASSIGGSLVNGVPSPDQPAVAAEAKAVEPETEGSSAILKAGGILAVDGHFGAAEILPPSPGQSGWPPVPTAAAPAKSVKPASAKSVNPAPAKPPTKAPMAPKTAAPAQVKKTAKSNPPQTVPAAGVASGGSLIIINGTGQEQVGEQYRSVLTKMGFKVVSVGQGEPDAGATGQTVINYRPGHKAQAQAVASRLPGRKVLVEAKGGQVLASEIMIHLR